MATGEWKIGSKMVQGDFSYSLTIEAVYRDKIVYTLVVFSEKWDNVDLAFEYRRENDEQWRTNARIVKATSRYLIGNKLYDLSTSDIGSTHTLEWKYSKNECSYGPYKSKEFQSIIHP